MQTTNAVELADPEIIASRETVWRLIVGLVCERIIIWYNWLSVMETPFYLQLLIIFCSIIDFNAFLNNFRKATNEYYYFEKLIKIRRWLYWRILAKKCKGIFMMTAKEIKKTIFIQQRQIILVGLQHLGRLDFPRISECNFYCIFTLKFKVHFRAHYAVIIWLLKT